MHRIVFLLVFLCTFSVGFLFSDPIILTVNNFQVDSKDPEHEFIGKGISLLVSSELRKSSKIKLLERNYLNKVLQEQEFSVSALSDTEQQVKIGILLSADYIIFGTIVNMGNSLIFSLRMVNVESGEIQWQEELIEKLDKYDYIGAYFANSILKALNADVEKTIVEKIEKKEEKGTEAIVRLSEGIDAYDKGDLDKAEKEMKKVTKLDPENEVAKYYISTLTTSSAKFRVETDLYTATYNPASLGFIKHDQIYTVSSMAMYPPEADEYGTIKIDDYDFKEYPMAARVGYYFIPISGLGLALEIIGGYADMMIGTPYEFDLEGSMINDMHPDYPLIGGSLLVGYKITDTFSLGISAIAVNVSTGTGGNNYLQTGLFWGIDGGFLLYLLDNNLTIDSHVAYANKKEAILDTVDKVGLFDSVPIIIDNSVTLALLDRSLYIAAKGIIDLYYNHRGGYGLRLIPIVEYKVLSILSIRAGYEYSHLDQAGRFTIGWGLLGGLTLNIWNFELSGNYTLRQIPSKMLPGYLIPGSTFSFSFSFSKLFFK